MESIQLNSQTLSVVVIVVLFSYVNFDVTKSNTGCTFHVRVIEAKQKQQERFVVVVVPVRNEPDMTLTIRRRLCER